jgi:cellulose synthase/poly-beta-1,6-N-acetylglucosamine synthase-like glycosyltransferase/EAL domain-containing protein (putative c-di-GMP-specific phosphodiesterase class I)/chitodextrinase
VVSSLHPVVSDGRLAVGRIFIVLTIAAWVAYLFSWFFSDFLRGGESATERGLSVLYLLVVTALTVSTIAYLLSRLGFFYRAREHHRASRSELEAFFDNRIAPTLTVLVPSYREEVRVIRSTLLSAALQEYPVSIVLLVDDPPHPSTQEEANLLEGARSLPLQLNDLLGPQKAHWETALEEFERTHKDREVAERASLLRLAQGYTAAAEWLRVVAGGLDVEDHASRFFVEKVPLALAEEFSMVAAALREAADSRAGITTARARQLYRRLAWTFSAEVSSFERKQYVNTFSEPNKAANLNSFIGLMGGSWKERRTPAGLALVTADEGDEDLSVPSPDYVLTLDADSVLLPEYCLRLVHLMEQEEHQLTAVAQTPYSAFPGAGTRIERVAGATTDLQHLQHQGLTYFGATFWVGANAVIRKAALDSIRRDIYQGDWKRSAYISDRTVIEDTESTMDMEVHGWQLYNYPERLSYSATPPDFGSLCIQRRRWATGGLIIAPKIRTVKRTRKERGERTRFGEVFLRANYMASIAWSSLGLLILLAYPFSSTLVTPLLGLVALPYFWAMASDLKYCGYKRTDIARVYGFNLLLLPVNLAGVLATVVQAVTAAKVPFARTPKVRDRTVAPPLFVVAPWALLLFAAATAAYAWSKDRPVNFVYGVLNTALTAYALVAFVGLRNSLVDASIHAWRFLSRPAPVKEPKPRPHTERPAVPDWRAVLGLAAAEEGEALSYAVFQPVCNLGNGEPEGYEALARFDDGSRVPSRLAHARSQQEAVAIEAKLVRAALKASASLPRGAWVAVKASALLLAEAPDELLKDLGKAGRPVVVEVPAPAAKEGVRRLVAASHRLPANVSLAVEHVQLGSHVSSLLGQFAMAYLKLDPAATAGIANDQSRLSSLGALLRAAAYAGTKVVASGVEHEDDRAALAAAGVPLAQGFLLGRPEEPPGAREHGEPVAPPTRPAPHRPRVKQRLSLSRAAATVSCAAALAWGVGYEAVPRVLAVTQSRSQQWFAPYIDATLTPLYQFQDPSQDPAHQVVLGFVVADAHGACVPSWGGAYTLAAAGTELSMGARIAQLQQEGVGVGISFGGQANTELAVACSNPTSLWQAWLSVVRQYSVHFVDLDVEGAGLSSLGVDERRAQAVKRLEAWARQNHWPLQVWLTLPVAADGLQANALAAVSAFFRARAGLSGVNLMTMDMGAAPAGVAPQAEQALKAAHGQLQHLYARWGDRLTALQVWQHMGATVMIGQNDDAGEVLTTADASKLLTFVERRDVRRVSMWDLNRDSQCGSDFSEDILSNVCSGTAQQQFEFSTIFGSLAGTWSGAQPKPITPPQPDLNPAAAPYPQWSPTTPYSQGWKVVRDGYIYQAKWYNFGVDPAQQVQDPWQTPWELIGPVLPGDHAQTLKRLPAGTYPAWSPTKKYQVGAKVLYNGLPYTAKWLNQGASPAAAQSDPYNSPWQPDYTIPGEPTQPGGLAQAPSNGQG